MAVVTCTAAQVAPLNAEFEGRTYFAGGTITPGQVVFLNTGGSAVAAKADAGTTTIPAGIALGSANPGQPVTCIIKGRLAGFDLSSQAYGAPLWLSAGTAGLIEDAQAGSGNYKVPLGRVSANSESGNITKSFDVHISLNTYYGTAAQTGA